MQAILCSRGKGGGCRVVNLPDVPVTERRDLFGRTEVHLVAAIARAKRRIAISEVWRGNEGVALKQEMMRSNMRVDERCLARVRGEQVQYREGEEPLPNLTGAALDKWRDWLCHRRSR